MALHADPGPPGSDSHFLVVIAMAAAAREGIAQPEVLLQRNGIGEIGKARRPLVRRNDEIRVSAVMNSHTLRVHDLRSEEHTSELQSLMRISYAVFCLKKKKHNTLDKN